LIGERLSPWDSLEGVQIVPGHGTVAVVQSRRTDKVLFSTAEDARAIAMAVTSGLKDRPRSVFFSRVRVDVGADGLCIRKRGSERFIPFARIESITEGSNAIRITTTDGAILEWFSTRDNSVQPFALSLKDARTRDRRRREERAASDRPTGAQVIAALGEADYRNPAYPVDVLLRIAEDPTEEVGTRVSATRALRQRAEPVDLARVRVAATQTASPDLRTSLEELAAEDPSPERRETRV
jgi:hypothetical protein